VYTTISAPLLKQILSTNTIDRSAASTRLKVAVAVRSMAP